MIKNKISWLVGFLIVIQSYFGFVVLRQFDLLHLHGFKQIVTGFRSESPVLSFSRYRVFDNGDFDLQSNSGIKRFVASHEAVLPGSSNQITEPRYSKIPIQLPETIKKCATKIGLDNALLQVDRLNTSSSPQYIFLNLEPLVAGIKLTALDSGCSVKFVQILQKTNTSWMLSKKISTGLPDNQLPARMDFDGKNGYVMSRFGKLYKFDPTDSRDNAPLKEVTSKTEFSPSNASESNGIAGEGVKSILVHGDTIYYSIARVLKGCGKLQLFSYPINTPRKSTSEVQSSLIYQTSGCFSGPEVNLGAVGGRIILGEANQKGNIIFSIGNPEIWQGSENIYVKPDLGRIVSISLDTYSVKTVSNGHRNPQGLCYENGTLWSTEQGPEGGDELNIIKNNRNYGWPFVTMGHAYGTFISPGSIRSFSDSGFEKPIFNFVPSVAAGAIKCPSLTSPTFLNPDFFMATLRDTSIHRLRIENARLVLDERIPMGARIRDINWLPNNDLLALTDGGEIITILFVSLLR